MSEIKHIPECIHHMAIYKMRVTKFKKRYPNYCKACDAFGSHSTTDWEGYPDVEDCPECLGKDLCPRCMTPTMVSKEETLIPASVDHLALMREWEQCSVCGWRGDDDYGDKYCLPFKMDDRCVCD